MTRLETWTLAALLGLVTTAPAAHDPNEPRPVDLAICLDTSGSMEGLIHAARQNIWAIVNDLALATPTPRLRIALLTFGNDGHDEAAGWVEVQTAFTDDLDLVSSKLFALATNGGNEYVGRVLQTSLQKLEWSTDADALKLIVVAGNEEADQDKTVHYRDVCRAAIEQNIMVNAIYCGNVGDEIAPGWREVAQLADGQFAAIDKDNGTITIETPFDDQLAALSTDLNTTYIPIGEKGAEGARNQSQQDSNAGKLNKVALAQRAQTKACGNYVCSWDLVDASKKEDFKLESIAADQLPEAMRSMTLEQRAQHIEEMGTKRATIQKQINDLTGQRKTFVAAEMKRRALDNTKSFDFAVRRAIQNQARAKGFAMPNLEGTPEVENR